LALEGIEPETFGGANFKIPSQPLGQPQMGKDFEIIEEDEEDSISLDAI